MYKHRNIFAIYIFSLITFGIYSIVWFVKTKNEMNEAGAKIPTAWLIIIPIANLYWMYRYCEGYATVAKKDNNAILWFIVALIAGWIIPAIFQSTFNRLAAGVQPQATQAPPQEPVQPAQPQQPQHPGQI